MLIFYQSLNPFILFCIENAYLEQLQASLIMVREQFDIRPDWEFALNQDFWVHP